MSADLNVDTTRSMQSVESVRPPVRKAPSHLSGSQNEVAPAVLKPEHVRPERLRGPLERQVFEAKETRSESVFTKQLQQKAAEEESTLQTMTSQVNHVMDAFNKGLRFEVNNDTDTMYVEVVNKDTNEVIKTIPSEEVMDMMERMQNVIGMLMDVEG